MKTKIIALSGFVFVFCCVLLVNGNSNSDKERAQSAGNSIIVQTSPTLFSLTSHWAAEFNKINPGTKIEIKQNSNADQPKEGNLSFLSDENIRESQNSSSWKMVLGRDAIIPVFNPANPFMKEIGLRGITPGDLSGMLKNQESHNWGILLNNSANVPVHLFMISDESVQKVLASFMNINSFPTEGIRMVNKSEFIAAVQQDPYALGFCRLTDIVDVQKQSIVSNVQIIPIDKNGNGKMDRFEKIYSDFASFQHGVWIGKYPQNLCKNIYTIASSKPTDKGEVAFLKWILSDGQQYLNRNGYTELVSGEREAKSALLTESLIQRSDAGSTAETGFIFILIIVVTGIVIGSLYRLVLHLKMNVKSYNSKPAVALDPKSLIIPKGLFFDKSHTWAFMEKEGNVRIGIDDFIQHITGPVNRIKMKNPGEKVNKGEVILSLIQNGKQLNLYSPVSGTVRQQNDLLLTDPSLLNNSPYSNGWIYLIEPSNWLRETRFMVMTERYSEWLNYEFTRVKDFLSSSVMMRNNEFAAIVLQDGGTIKDNILADFGPEVWEDFQTNFIDQSN